MPISDSIFQCDDRTTVGHFGKNSWLCQILHGRFQVISFQKILFVFLTVLIISWRGLIWVSAEPLPCTPRLTVTQIVYMQSSTNTQVGFKIPAWSLIFGWFWLSSQPDLCFLVGFDIPPSLIFVNHQTCSIRTSQLMDWRAGYEWPGEDFQN